MATEVNEADLLFRSAYKPTFRPPSASDDTPAAHDASIEGSNGFNSTLPLHAKTKSLERDVDSSAPVPLNGQAKTTRAPSTLRKPSGTCAMKFDDSLELEQIFKDESEDLFFVDEQEDAAVPKGIVSTDLRAQNAPTNTHESIDEQFQALSVSDPVRGASEPRVDGAGRDLTVSNPDRKQTVFHKKGPGSKVRPASSRSSSATNGTVSRQPKPDVNRARQVSDSALDPKSTPNLDNGAAHASEPTKASSEKVRKKVKLRAADLGLTSLKSLGPEALHEAVARWKMENGQVGVVTSITIQPVKDTKGYPSRVEQTAVERNLSSNTDVHSKDKSPTRSICSAQTVKCSNNVNDKAMKRSGMDDKIGRHRRSLPGAHENAITGQYHENMVQAPRHASLGTSNTSVHELQSVNENARKEQKQAESNPKNGIIQPQSANSQGAKNTKLDVSTSISATINEKTSRAQDHTLLMTESVKVPDKEVKDLAVSSHEERAYVFGLPSQVTMDPEQIQVQENDASRTDVSATLDERVTSKSSSAYKVETPQIGFSHKDEGFRIGVSQQQLGMIPRQKTKSTSQLSRHRKPLRSEELKTKLSVPSRKRTTSSTEAAKPNALPTSLAKNVSKQPQASSREATEHDGIKSRKRDINEDKKGIVEGRVSKKRTSLRKNSVTKTKTSSAGQNRLEKDGKTSMNQDTPSSHLQAGVEKEVDFKSESTITKLARKSLEKGHKHPTRMRGRSEGPGARRSSEQPARTKVRSRSAAVPETRVGGLEQDLMNTAKAEGEITRSGSQSGLSTAVLYDSHRGSFRDLMKGALRRVSSRYLSDADNQTIGSPKTGFLENAAGRDEPPSVPFEKSESVGDNGVLPGSQLFDDMKVKLGRAGISENQVEALRKMGLKITTV